MYCSPSTDTDTMFEDLLIYLRQNHGFDFTGYKRSSLMRRVQCRMQMLPIEGYSDYIEYLKEHPEEYLLLFKAIDINYTMFFRDRANWDYVTAQIIPQILANKQSNEPIRIWSAGCASGEEIYTLAIILAEALGVEQFRSRVQIYATDVDEDALKQARQGSYFSSDVEGVPSVLLNRYFEQVGDRYTIDKYLRQSIIFNRHNLIEDAPMSKIDLLVCRNVLIYFEVEAQIKVLVRFYFGLKDSGFLFLGNTEIVPNEINSIFRRVKGQYHIFTKLPRENLNSRMLIKALKRPQLQGN